MIPKFRSYRQPLLSLMILPFLLTLCSTLLELPRQLFGEDDASPPAMAFPPTYTPTPTPFSLPSLTYTPTPDLPPTFTGTATLYPELSPTFNASPTPTLHATVTPTFTFSATAPLPTESSGVDNAALIVLEVPEIALPETFSAAVTDTDFNLTLTYPQGWIANNNGDGIALGSSLDAIESTDASLLISEGDQVMRLNAVSDAVIRYDDAEILLTIRESLAGIPGVTLAETERIRLNNWDGNRIPFTATVGGGFLYLLNFEPGYTLVALVLADNIVTFEDTSRVILASARLEE